jgi:hypothetical protein
MNIPGRKALELARGNAGRKYPARTDPRHVDGMLVPALRPRFRIDLTQPVFTLGSCFAREIEEVLLRRGVTLPTREFVVPKEEWPYRPSGLLNEYNPGSMHQRIRAALTGTPYPESTGVASDQGVIDLLLSQGPAISAARFRERRADIDRVYARLADCGLVIITLGLVEAWYDEETSFFLNRMPLVSDLRAQPKRFRFVRFSYDEACRHIEQALGMLVETHPGTRVLLTVSPVPLEATFTESDAVIANGYSKAVLRACVERMTARFPQVDYFPSYEMVLSAGPAALKADNVHVTDAAVERVMQVLLANYVDVAA